MLLSRRGCHHVKPLLFRQTARHKRARSASIELPHGPVQTPVFMPVATKASLKSLTSEQLKHLGFNIILCNSYHLAMLPGAPFLARCGSVHSFMGWKGNILTDSGGYQMVSFGELSSVSEEGVAFTSPYGDRPLFISPEDSVVLQSQIGADIIMAFDDVVQTTGSVQRIKEAAGRTMRWLDRNLAVHDGSQALFPIVQGGLDLPLRRSLAQQISQRKVLGFAIGGLSGGEGKEQFWQAVSQTTRVLPEDRPRYLMGVGYPEDMLVSVALGVDMFDCVFPCRTARFGTALTNQGPIRLTQKRYRKDFRPIETDCRCPTCANYTRAFLHSLAGTEAVCCSLITSHNLYFQERLMQNLREAIRDNTLQRFAFQFLSTYFGGKVPEWVRRGLEGAQLQINWSS